MDIGKPIRISYINNEKHKETQIRKCRLYMMGAKSENRMYLVDGNWNHKKTNAQKAMWSCGGYGGKCPSCKSSNNYGSHKLRTDVYEFNGEKRHFL